MARANDTGDGGLGEPERAEPRDRDPDATAQLDAVFDVLRDERRRFVLYALDRTNADRVSVSELAGSVRELVAAADADPDPTSLDRLEAELYHSHLPKLDAFGAVELVPERDEVRCQDLTALSWWLEQTRSRELPTGTDRSESEPRR